MSASDRCPDCGHCADVHSDLLGLSFCDGGGPDGCLCGRSRSYVAAHPVRCPIEPVRELL